MATAKAYGSITIVDIGDLGTLSVYPESNQPSSVIYDPNQNGGIYNPSWESNNLKLTPIIYYGGTQINATNAKVSVVWRRKVGSGSEVDIASSNGESMDASSKFLVVNKNVLNSDNPIITYICEASYVEPQTGTTLTAKGQISFSLISQPTTLKSCSVIGENVFLYNSANAIVGAESITLTAKLDNCSITNWQYKKSDGTSFETIPGQISNTLTIKASDDYFVNDVATIRLNTNIDGLYDLHTITKIRDGAPGESVLSVVLDNEDMYVPCDSNGNLLEGALDQAKTKIYVYSGNDDVTSDAVITTPQTSGATGTYDRDSHTYTVTSMTALTATVTFTVVYNHQTITKIFYLTKLKAGADGTTPTIYSLKPSALVVNRTITDAYVPAFISFRACSKTGDEDDINYQGRFKIYLDDDVVYTSSNDELSKKYVIPIGEKHSTIKAELYKAGGTTTLLDSQTVTVVSDGETGAEGIGGLSFVLGNYSDNIPCNTNRTATAAYTIKIPFTAYKGIERIACTASCGSLPSGMSISSNVAGTDSSDGCITIVVAANSTLGGTTSSYDTGTILITLTANDVTSQQSYTWTKNIQAAAGADAVILQAYAPNGNIINNGENDITLSALMTSGTITVTPDAHKWYVFKNSGYQEISDSNTYGGHTGYTTATLTVPASAVDSYASYRVDATYNGQTYQAYISVQDKTDPLQVEVFSTLGDKITNSVGVGCVYARVFQDGVELDELQNLKVSVDAPSSPVTNDVWAHIDNSQSTPAIILKKWSGSAWTAFTPSYACSYNWTFGDYDGNATNLGSQASSSDKFLYVDGSYITKKMQFNLEVTK